MGGSSTSGRVVITTGEAVGSPESSPEVMGEGSAVVSGRFSGSGSSSMGFSGSGSGRVEAPSTAHFFSALQERPGQQLSGRVPSGSMPGHSLERSPSPAQTPGCWHFTPEQTRPSQQVSGRVPFGSTPGHSLERSPSAAQVSCRPRKVAGAAKAGEAAAMRARAAIWSFIFLLLMGGWILLCVGFENNGWHEMWLPKRYDGVRGNSSEIPG